MFLGGTKGKGNRGRVAILIEGEYKRVREVETRKRNRIQRRMDTVKQKGEQQQRKKVQIMRVKQQKVNSAKQET